MKKPTSDLEQTDELVIARTFVVPVELVWKSWTNPALFKKWCGPKGFSCSYCEMVLHAGGKYLLCMQTPRGYNIWFTGTYLEIIPHEKLVFTARLADEDGNVVSGSYYGMEEIPMEMKVAIVLKAVKNNTELTVQHNRIPGNFRDWARTGWNESFDKLTAKLKKRTQWS